MNVVPGNGGPEGILRDSELARIADTYFSAVKRRERKNGCSATRGFAGGTVHGTAHHISQPVACGGDISSLPHVSRPAVQAFIASLAYSALARLSDAA